MSESIDQGDKHHSYMAKLEQSIDYEFLMFSLLSILLKLVEESSLRYKQTTVPLPVLGSTYDSDSHSEDKFVMPITRMRSWRDRTRWSFTISMY